MKQLEIRENDAGQRLDRFLLKAFPQLTKGMMYKALRNKKIKVNRKRASYDQKLNEGDIILLFLPEDALVTKADLEKGKASGSYGKEAAGNSGSSPTNRDGRRKQTSETDRKGGNGGVQPLQKIFESDNLVVAFKPEGILSQKDQADEQVTMNELLRDLLIKEGVYDPETELTFIPAFAGRLDRNTIGLMAAGKNAKTLRMLNNMLADHSLHKKYLAEVEGNPEDSILSLWMAKEGTRALVSDIYKEGYQDSLMEIENLGYNPRTDTSLIQIDLKTGRFHQIRASMAHLGHPLVGDSKYGYKGKEKHQHLAAWILDFTDTPLSVEAGEIRLNPDRIPWITKEQAFMLKDRFPAVTEKKEDKQS